MSCLFDYRVAGVAMLMSEEVWRAATSVPGYRDELYIISGLCPGMSVTLFGVLSII